MKCQTVLLFAGLVSVCNAYRILGVFPFNMKSHDIIMESVMKTLAKHGHQVDVVTHFPQKKPIKNYNEIINLEGSLEKLVDNLSVGSVSEIKGNMVTKVAVPYGNRLCHLMGLEEFQKLIKNPPKDPPYDLVITEAYGAHCFMGLGYTFKVPVVAISPTPEFPWISHFTGNADNLAVSSHIHTIGARKMSFWEVMRNVYTSYSVVKKFHELTEKSQTSSMRKYLGPSSPSVRAAEKNVALTLVNTHPIISGVRPITPAVVQIAGLHVETNEDTLPRDLQEWMDESTHGVVCFTLGSMVLIETLPAEQLKEIYSSFGKISPVRVLMKVTDASKLPAGLPSNVKVLPWMPQQKVLAHPNTRVFMSHGGNGGIIEALHYGVPMIGIPLFCDQHRNVDSLKTKGILIRIPLKDLSQKTLDAALESLLKDPSYNDKAKFYSRVFRDRPMSPSNETVYWIEYVIRNGGDVLRSPALEFTWWQLQLLDVYGFVLLVLVLVLMTIVMITRLIFKKIFVRLSGKVSKRNKLE